MKAAKRSVRSRSTSNKEESSGQSRRRSSRRSLAKSTKPTEDKYRMVILAISPRAARVLYKILGKADEDDPVIESLRTEIMEHLR